VLLTRALELSDDPIALGRRRIDRHEVVVVKVHSPRSDLREHRDGVHRRQGLPDGIAERIAAAIADRPQSERELVFRTRLVLLRHGFLLSAISYQLSAITY
jgi:hypothetical protein